jgi:zinc finger protein
MRDNSLGGSTTLPELIGTEKVRCPSCGDYELTVSMYVVETRFFGKVVIESGKCARCGFLYRDVYLAEYGEPRKFEVKVLSGSAGDYLLVKSSSATVIIPELGIEIAPGPAAQGYITTARGILENVYELLVGLCRERDGECSKKLDEVLKALEGEVGFTLILDDPLGRSAVIKLP